MQLFWSDVTGIAEALCRAYPEEDRLAVDAPRLKEMILALPEFGDKPNPPRQAYLDSVLWTWMRLADEGGRGT